ncbi:MAG: NUDIX domain-containing protein [Phycisphaeraceae bacterium]|nr:NUDIX domain-containing protein [Phycisphaeraceae bacterium]
MPKWNRSAAKKIELLARGIAVHDGHILLCKNKKSDYWYFPGGHIEPGEPASEALEREFLEETGKRVPAGRLIFIHEHFFKQDDKPRHEYSFVFEVRAPQKIKAKEKHLDFQWVKWSEAERLDIRPKALSQMVGVFLEEHALNRHIRFRSTRKS